MSKKKHHTQKPREDSHTALEKHRRVGSKLFPPLAQLPALKPSPWRDERMPEMLWAGLLFSSLTREMVIDKVNELAAYISKFRETEDPPFNISLSGIAKLPSEQADTILQIITSPEEFGRVLSPLLLLDTLPVRQLWEKYLGSYEPDRRPLLVAVSKLLNHQSEESTDCRWARIICMIAAGKLAFPKELEEIAKGIVRYPYYGDLRVISPMIRSTEVGFSQLLDEGGNWSASFWAECLEKTGCFPMKRSDLVSIMPGTSREKIEKVFSELLEHCNKTRTTTAVDAKHETMFGFAFYSLTLLKELLRINASQTISAQLALRTLVECYITIAYLTKKNDEALWKSYRVFGAGQAKLTYLKLEASDTSTNYVDIETVRELANEDIWEEFLPIELGHWDKANLRQLSEEAGVKSVYDKYYSWTSSYLHGHWGSIRDTVYETCGNPLHRLHRIPVSQPHLLADVLPDACMIVDNILQLVSASYPTIVSRVSVVSQPIKISGENDE